MGILNINPAVWETFGVKGLEDMAEHLMYCVCFMFVCLLSDPPRLSYKLKHTRVLASPHTASSSDAPIS